ncbi:MAG TPA: hypothetical protein VE570_12315, partial [Thermoleophilaceae bacterium]|nr:hypothetical protein [Thermoleophilaceae bacterium]
MAAPALPSLAANPANKLLSRGIDPIAYDRATKCNGGKVWPGTKAMVTWLERNASGVNWGEYRCELWGKHEASVHSDGRAIDWHPATMRDGRALVRLLLAPDEDGNPAALARRMGIQGLIFDCQSWFGGWDGKLGDYSYCYRKDGTRKKNIDVTQAHIDHVHIELNLLGAAMKTTFWNKTISYATPERQPAPQPQQPAPLPWQSNGQTGGGQYDNPGGTW